ncbi:hypothetical protein CBER1_08150 [Cercospora berteroae]|uniref:Uncharacterized protein n=1 Tax=Cercospora berteroae TaxID=357750 RepID=A0A2S6CLH6_9PEZI|nr:hypothetical protein CBER1_08150 [Cercospora berteroae]
MFLDGLTYFDPYVWKRVIGACKQQLTSISFRGRALIDTNDDVRTAQRVVPNLKSFMFHGGTKSDRHKYLRNLFMPEGLGDNLNSANIRDVAIVASDLILQAIRHWNDDGRSKQLTRREKLAEWLAHEHGEPGLPRTVETLAMAPYSEAAESLDDALSALISAEHGERAAGDQDETAMHDEGQQGTSDSSERYESSTTTDGQISRSGTRYVYPQLKAVHVNPLDRLVLPTKNSIPDSG